MYNIETRSDRELYLIVINDEYYYSLKDNFKGLIRELNRFYMYNNDQLLYLFDTLQDQPSEVSL